MEQNFEKQFSIATYIGFNVLYKIVYKIGYNIKIKILTYSSKTH